MAHAVIDGHINARVKHMGMPDDVKPTTLVGLIDRFRNEKKAATKPPSDA